MDGQPRFIPAGSEPSGRGPGRPLNLALARPFGERREGKCPLGANTPMLASLLV